MSSTLDRLRRLHGLRTQRTGSEPKTPDGDLSEYRANHGSAPADLLPGEVVENSAGTCYLVTERFSLQEPRGAQPLGALLQQDPAAIGTFHPDFGIPRQADFLNAAFIDTETTGLGSGAGVYAFMVGVGTFEPAVERGEIAAEPDFVVRQFFMRNPAEEGAMLLALADLLSRHDMSVTFNGRTFDLPLLRTRYRQNYWALSIDYDAISMLEPERAHLDLLHPARRLWRRRLQSCRLINLEENILGLHRTDDDVPGHLIPQVYIDFTRTRNAREINNVFYHNREDIVSMVPLAEQLARVLSATPDELDEADLVGADWSSLGQSYEQRGDLTAAERAYVRALELIAEDKPLAEAFQRLGQLQKRQDRWDEATDTWQRWITTVADNDPHPYVELAKYCEWRSKDLEQAEMWTGWALHNLRSAAAWQRSTALIEQLEHRLTRIQRKRASSPQARPGE